MARLGRGGSLHAALDALEIPAELHAPILEALGRHVDFRRLPAETGLSVVRSVSGSVLSVACRPAFEHYVRVMLEAGAASSAARVDVETQDVVVMALGVLTRDPAALLPGEAA